MHFIGESMVYGHHKIHVARIIADRCRKTATDIAHDAQMNCDRPAKLKSPPLTTWTWTEISDPCPNVL